MMSFSPPYPRAARWCFLIPSLWTAGVIVMWQVNTSQPFAVRVLVGIAIWGIIGVGLPEGYRWIRDREAREARSGVKGASKVAATEPAKAMKRVISPDQRRRMLGVLRKAPTGDIQIACVANDREASEFAAQIRGVLAEAGWNPSATYTFIVAGIYPVGVQFRVHAVDSAPARARFLKQAFDVGGISSGWKEFPSIPEGKFEILVGGIPEPL